MYSLCEGLRVALIRRIGYTQARNKKKRRVMCRVVGEAQKIPQAYEAWPEMVARQNEVDRPSIMYNHCHLREQLVEYLGAKPKPRRVVFGLEKDEPIVL